jgi:hypothetical protein
MANATLRYQQALFITKAVAIISQYKQSLTAYYNNDYVFLDRLLRGQDVTSERERVKWAVPDSN